MLDRKHKLVVQDIFTLFPTAKILNSKSTEPAIKASNSAYTDFSRHQKHRSDNGPPYNSQTFTNLS